MTYPPEPRTEPDSVYAPDPTPDTETYPEVVQRVREALYQAAEQGAEHYEGKPGRLIDLIEVCRWILTNDDIREHCKTGQYHDAADDIAFKLDRQFGADFRRQIVRPSDSTYFQDHNLVDLVSWLQRREREVSQ